MRAVLLLSLLVVFGVSCSSHQEREEKSKAQSSERTSKKIGSTSRNEKQSSAHRNTSGEWKWEDCVRGIPEPICNPKAFKHHSFRLDSTSSPVYIGYEKATLKNGDILEIKNAGCEYYSLDFTFTTSRFKSDTNDLVYWCDAAIQLLKSIDQSVSGGIDVKYGYEVLQKYYLESEAPALKVEHQINDSEIGTYVSLERIEKISKTKYSVTIRYFVGPL